jgi:FixJ family two-component response regulator
MGSKRKRLNELNMEKKEKVLDLIHKGVSQRTIAVQVTVAKSTVGNLKTGEQY